MFPSQAVVASLSSLQVAIARPMSSHIHGSTNQSVTILYLLSTVVLLSPFHLIFIPLPNLLPRDFAQQTLYTNRFDAIMISLISSSCSSYTLCRSQIEQTEFVMTIQLFSIQKGQRHAQPTSIENRFTTRNNISQITEYKS